MQRLVSFGCRRCPHNAKFACMQVARDVRTDAAEERQAQLLELLPRHPRVDAGVLDSDGRTSLFDTVRWAATSSRDFSDLLSLTIDLAVEAGLDVNHQARIPCMHRHACRVSCLLCLPALCLPRSDLGICIAYRTTRATLCCTTCWPPCQHGQTMEPDLCGFGCTRAPTLGALCAAAGMLDRVQACASHG